MKNLKLLKEKYMEYDKIHHDLNFQHVLHHNSAWTEEEQEKENKRYEEVGKQLEAFEKEYEKWKIENDLFDQCMDWCEELYGFVLWRDNNHLWRDWATDEETNERVQRTVNEISEEDVEKFIDLGRKILNSVKYLRERDYYEIHEFLDYVGYINKAFRYDIDDGGMAYLGMDILENRRLYIPYKEDFIDCLKKVAAEVDWVFLNYYEDEWGEREEEWSEDIEDYYED